MWSWGGNNYGQLGINQSPYNLSSPVQIGSLTNWSRVAAGRNFCLAIKTDNTLWVWGRNNYGQLGLGDTVNRSSPVQVGSLTNWYQVRGGAAGHTIAIKTDGTLWSWGQNGNGQLGLNDTYGRSSPVQIGALTNWSQAAAHSGRGTTVIKTSGTLWAWGKNLYGNLGQNDTVDRSSPVQVGALSNWYLITSGSYHRAAIKTDGTLWAWGNNASGQLGQNDTVDRSSPVQVGSLATWTALPQMFVGYTTFAIKG
jgi:alpha-tubulin suppressor-like RCC1 family protein